MDAKTIRYNVSKAIFRGVRRLLQRQSQIEQISDADFVRYCYKRILDRRPDEAVIDDALVAFSRGERRIEFIEKLLESEEYHNKPTEFVESGHFYSVIPSRTAIDEANEVNQLHSGLSAINLRADMQWVLLRRLQLFYDEMLYDKNDREHLRYQYDNGSFAPSDAIILYAMMRNYRPKRIIEVGSGWSSGVILDTNEHFLQNQAEITFIEPYPELLYSVMNAGDLDNVRVLSQKVQSVDLAVFAELEVNDILFIDSSHVSKLGSDVNHLFFKILPLLKPGVIIHIHDIFYPFRFPSEWLEARMFWNEHYLLRAFLQYNDSFNILLFSSMMIEQHQKWVAENMPDCLKVGGCIWLQKGIDPKLPNL